jgi:hypothetical protein
MRNLFRKAQNSRFKKKKAGGASRSRLLCLVSLL